MILTTTDPEGNVKTYGAGCSVRLDTWTSELEVWDSHGNYVETVSNWTSYTMDRNES